MEMTGLQIFKYLPGAKKEEHTNCKECGCPTCMAFALKLAKQNKYTFKIVTLKGDIINPSGGITGGSVQAKTVNILGRAREIDELKNDIKKIKSNIEEISKQLQHNNSQLNIIDFEEYLRKTQLENIL